MRLKSWKICNLEFLVTLKSPKSSVISHLPLPASSVQTHLQRMKNRFLISRGHSAENILARKGKKTLVHPRLRRRDDAMTEMCVKNERNQKKEQIHRYRSGKILTKIIKYFTIKARVFHYSREQ